MAELNEESVLVIRRDKKVIGFVHLDVKGGPDQRTPVFYKSTTMGFDDLKELIGTSEGVIK